MKQFVILLLTVLGFPIAAPVQAQNTLDVLESACSGIKSVEASFIHVKTVKATGKSTTFTGRYYYTSPDKMAMAYDQDSEGLVLSGNQFYIRRGGKTHKGEIQRVKQMRQLSEILFACIRGKVRGVAEGNGADLSAKTEKGFHNVTLTAKKKASKGFSRIVLRYRASDGLLTYLLMEEFSGTTNEYTLTDPKSVAEIAAARFAIPKK